MFRVPTFKIGDLRGRLLQHGERAIEYVTGTLDPYFTCWEEAIRRDLLTTRQYGQFDVTFDRSALIRKTCRAQHEALARVFDAGFYSANDARRKLG